MYAKTILNYPIYTTRPRKCLMEFIGSLNKVEEIIYYLFSCDQQKLLSTTTMAIKSWFLKCLHYRCVQLSKPSTPPHHPITTSATTPLPPPAPSVDTVSCWWVENKHLFCFFKQPGCVGGESCSKIHTRACFVWLLLTDCRSTA